MKRLMCWTLTLGLVAVAAGQDKLLKDPVEILKKADAATKAVNSVKYDAKSEATGWLKDRVGLVKGSVILGGGTSETLGNAYFEARVKTPNSDEVTSVRAGTDGKIFFAINPKLKTVTKSDSPRGYDRIGGAASRLAMPEFVHPAPFTEEANAFSAKLETVEDVAGEKCYRIRVEYTENGERAVWHISTRDFLPRRVARISKGEDGADGSTVLTISHLVTSPKLSDNTFTLNVPDGFKVETIKTPPPPKMLAVGSKAPDWSLQTPGGETVSLSQLHGSVVLLDFWAVWCGPCKAAMPHVQKLHEQYKGKGVKVFGLNTWEKETNDPLKYMKDKEYTYGLLLESDDVAKAYKVTGIPTFYVIDQKGNIAHVSVGYNPNGKEIEEAIDRLLKDREG